MRRSRWLPLLVALLTCAGLGVSEAVWVAAHRSDLVAARDTHARLQRELTEARRRQDAWRADLQAAEHQLGQLSAITVTIPKPPAANRDPLVAAWLARTKQLRDLAKQRPADIIPEMQWLRDEDWLRVARDALFDTDAERRRALAALRAAAKAKFIERLSPAARKFTLADPLKIPTDILALTPYFDAPIDPAILQRYEIKADPSQSTIRRAHWFVCEIAAIDDEYDSRVRVDGTGSHGSSSGHSAWIDDFGSRLQRAARAYAAAHNGEGPKGVTQAAPYFDPPLPPAALEKILRAEADRAVQP